MKKNPIDKIHPIGGAKNENQARIIKTTTQSYRKKSFCSICEIKKIITRKESEKIPRFRCRKMASGRGY